MTTDRWHRIEALYHEMLAHPEDERAAALAAACPGDAALQAEVQSLLDQPESAAGFLATPAMEVAAHFVSPASSLLTGRRLGVFELQGLLGVGGMGEVYRARDTRLGRDVAIKILPRAFKDDPDRLARFEREARLLASLNHPHIGAIYGLEDADGVNALVMELVEGEDLSQRLARGPMPIDEALPIATADRRGPRSRARARHHPPGSETREHQGAAGRHGQGARFRAGESPGACLRRCPRIDAESHRRRRHHGDARVYESRTGARRSRGPPGRHLVVWRRALRTADRRLAVWPAHDGGHAGERARHATGLLGPPFGYASRCPASGPPLSGKGSEAPVATHGRRADRGRRGTGLR